MSNGNRAIELLSGEYWTMSREALVAMVEIARGYPSDGALRKDLQNVFHRSDNQALQDLDGELIEGARRGKKRGCVALIPILGPIFPRANLMTEVSGANSAEMIMKDIRAAIEAEDIESIILVIDSPGGSVTGISELSQYIVEARDKKRIISYVEGQASSAAYWIASATEKIIAADTAMLGSIGVLTTLPSKEEEGEVTIISSQSPYKAVDVGTEEGRERVQKIIDSLADIFIQAVANNRGLSPEEVLQNFGQGDVFLSAEAIERGMSDGEGTLEAVILEEQRSLQNKNGGFYMSERQENVQHTLTVEAVRESSPDTFEAIMVLGRAEGAKIERERIQAIEAVPALGHTSIVSQAKYDPDMTADRVARLVLEAQAKQQSEVISDLEQDSADVEAVASSIDGTTDMEADEVSEIQASARRIAKKHSRKK